MREKAGVDDRRRFRPGWMPSDDGGVDNPALSLEPPAVSASFSVGDPDAAAAAANPGPVTITVSDADHKHDTSAV